MIRIAFLALKGGVGKTMIATQIAVHACNYFERPALVDLDPTSGGTTTWFNQRQRTSKLTIPEFIRSTSDPEKAIKQAELARVDFLVMDGAPGTTEQTSIAAGLCDVVVLPLKAFEDDLDRVALAVRIVQDAGCKNLMFAINEVPLPSSNQPYIYDKALQFKAEFEKSGHPSVVINMRDVYARTRNTGLGVDELRGSGPAHAKKEMNELFTAILHVLGLEIA